MLDHTADPGATTTVKVPSAKRWHPLATTPIVAVAVGLLIAAVALFVNRNPAVGLDRVLRAPGLGMFDARREGRCSPTGSRPIPTGLTTGFGSVWATSYDAGTVARIAPRALTVTQTIRGWHRRERDRLRLGETSGLPTHSTIGSPGSTLTPMESSSKSALARTPLRSTVMERTVWVANTGDGTVTEIDALTGDVVRVIPVGRPPRRNGGRRRFTLGRPGGRKYGRAG